MKRAVARRGCGGDALFLAIPRAVGRLDERAAVRPIARHRLPVIGDRDDRGFQRKSAPGESLRIGAAVVTLVMRANERGAS
jgi:hypothetical protein